MIAVAALTFAGCHQKELLDECQTTMKLNVVFDWRNAPDAHVESMALYLFPADGGEPLRYLFQNSDGGEIAVPFGRYTALCMNNDNTDWARTAATSQLESFEILSSPASGLSLADLRSTVTETDEPDSVLVNSPELIWTDAGESLTLASTDTGVKTLTLFPQESGCHYTIDIYDIGNTASLENQSFLATFSGLAGGYHPGLSHSSEEHVSMPLVMTVDPDGSKIHGEFLNFGLCPDIIYKNELRLYCFLTDGTPLSYRFDVTDQTVNASDPRNVHIVLRGMPIPEPISGGGGLKPVVDDWIVEHITVPMP